jgi:predicted transposase/invertase (TIGR01784 family)
MAETDDEPTIPAQDAEAEAGVAEQSQKHDESYKSVLSVASNFLHLIKKYFANAPWIAGIADDTAERVDNSYVTSEYSNIDSDLIYKLKRGGSDVYFYVLMELQSQVDFTMPFRLLRYIVELLHDVFKNTDKNIRARKGFRLPAVVPMVLYNGYDNWTAVRTFREYTADYELFGDNIIDFRYLLFDLKRTDEETILSTKKMLDIILLLDKRRLENKGSREELDTCIEKYASGLPDNDVGALLRWIKYVYCKGDVSPDEEKRFINLIKTGGGKAMRHALEIQRDELIDEATHKEDVKIAIRLKNKGMSVDDIAEATGLTVDEILQL